ncbi:bryoporin-like [Chanos chanos]|uniref:Bryoporin-like n=1 Tax=Chanos chanos TaxID=29144 RepID=A0A6J2UUR6_CHACN|nr:bryoporin-like [Chanos chanos]
MYSGHKSKPPSPTVDTNTEEECHFSKTANTLRGAVGVLTYELLDKKKQRSDEIIAVMFSVPYGTTVFGNWFAVGIFEKTRPCDRKLFNLMYYKDNPSMFTRAKAKHPNIVHKGNSVEIRATMSDSGKATIKVELYNKH